MSNHQAWVKSTDKITNFLEKFAVALRKKNIDIGISTSGLTGGLIRALQHLTPGHIYI